MKQLSEFTEELVQHFAGDELTMEQMGYLKGGDGDNGGSEDPPPDPWN